MTDRSIKIVMSASVQGLVNGFKAAQTSAKNLNQAIVRNEQDARELTTTLGLIGAGAVAGAGYAIKTFATFDKQMSNVKATGAATATELTRLREAAVQAGASTAFSATEAAAGVENLLKAGVAASDVLGGGLAGSLDLAAAGELGVAEAAEIAATAMTQFNLSGKDVTHVADLLSAGAGKAAGDVTDIAQALNQAGLVASQTGLSIEEATGTLSAFASAGLLGSDAGTSFKTMLQRLSAPTKENAAYMAELGISAYDAQGQFVGMSALAGQLEGALKSMTPAQRNAALATIFGADAVRAASVVYEQGASGIDSWIKKVDDQGYAAKTAAARLDNLQGDLEELGGAFESFFIKSGGSGNDVMRGLVQGATDLVNALGSIDGDVLGGLTIALGAGGVIALGTAGVGKLVIGVNNAKAAMVGLGISAKVAGIAVGAVGAALGVAAVGLSIWAQNAAEAHARTEGYLSTLDELGNLTDSTLDTISSALASDRNSWLDNLFGDDPRSLIDIGKDMGLTVEQLTGYILEEKDAVDAVNRATEERRGKLIESGLGMSDATSGSEELRDALNGERDSLTDAQKEQAAKKLSNDALGKSEKQTAADVELVTKAAEDQAEAIKAASDAALAARDSQRGYKDALDAAKEALKENGKGLDRNTEAGRENEAALDNIAGSALRMVDDLATSGASADTLRKKMGRAREQFIETAESMGMSSEKAEKLADKLGLIPNDVSARVYVDTDTAQKAVDKFVTQNGGRTIKIGAHIVTQHGGTGDGEGAGWTGSTPRGVSQMSRAVQSMDPSARITSGYRPGAITATGHPSYHGMGRAIDIVSPNMGKTFDMLRNAFGSKAKELYYTPRGFIRNGQWTNNVAAVTRRTHHSHVHLALNKGGKVTGAGTGTSDDIPAWLSNGEHVLTARDVQAMGGQSGVYAFRDALHHAKGGAIGSAERDISSARRELERARKARRDAKKEKARDAAQKRVDKAEERLASARERLSALSAERRDLSTSLRRGDLISSATSGLDGAYGVTDDMRNLARSGSLTKSQRATLEKRANKAEVAMRGLYKEVARVDKRLESAANNTERLQGISDGVKSSLVGQQSLSDAIKKGQEGAFRDVTRTNSKGQSWTESVWDPGTKDSVTAKGLVADAKSKAAKIKAFSAKLNSLRAKGLSGVILQEIGEMGIDEGTLVADALLKDSGQVKSLNTAYKDVAKFSTYAGQNVTEGFSKGGLAAAKSFEAGLERQKASLEKRTYNWGVYMADGFTAAVTGKKSGLKKRAKGGPVSAGESYLVGEEGPELIVPSMNGHVMTAQQTRYLASTARSMRSTTAPASGPSVNLQVEKIVATDTQAAVDRMYTKAWDAINSNGVMALSQGVGV